MKKVLSLLLAMVLCFGLVACGGSDKETTAANGEAAEEKVSAKDTLVVVSAYTDPGNFSPWTQATAQAAPMHTIALEPLVKMLNGKWTPVLLESYEWKDDTTFVGKMRKGVKFHNGKEMTTEDIVFCLNLSRNAASSAGSYRMVDDITCTEDEVTIKLAYPDVDLFNALNTTYITDKDYYEEKGDQYWATNPVGTGYYMWDSYTTGDNITFKAFDDYWGEHGTIKTLTLRFISEASQALIDLENGNVNIMNANGSTITSVKDNKDLVIYQYDAGLNEYCGFNFNSEKVQDKRVREAVSYASDKADVVAAAREGLAYESYGVIPSTSLTYNKEVENYYKYDPDKAKSILSDLGYSESNPLELNLLTDTSAARKMEAEQVKNMLEAVGFKININSFESASVTSILAGGDAKDYDLFIRALGGLLTSDTVQIGTILNVEATAVGNNPTWITFENCPEIKTFQEKFEEAKRTVDTDKYKELILEMQTAERDAIMVNWMLVQNGAYAMSANLRGLTYGSIGGGIASYTNCYYVE